MKITILYASQTGYSEETAHRIQREAKQRHLKVDLKSMHEYNWASLPQEKLVVFVCSVTGQGDEPDTMTKFWKNLLRKSLAKESLAAMEFGVFGQGDSSYQKFNFPAKKLHKRLVQLGATPLVPRGDGDDQHYLGVDGALDPWLVQLWVEILKKYPIDKSLEIIPDTVLPDNIYSINILPLSQKVENKQQRGTYSAIVTKNNRITTTGHFQDVRHFEFKVNKADFTYNAGDSAVIYPKNRPEKIDLVLKYLGWHEIVDNYIEIIKNDDDEPEFASAEGQNDLYAYSHKTKRTTFEVLEDFNSVRVPLKYLLDLVPLMRPRYFSISSSYAIDHNNLQLTVAIVNYKTILQERRVGVCTDWMSQLKLNDSIAFDLAPGTFTLPIDSETPIICIGPGTGVAPMRSLLREYTSLSNAQNVLFFGCRSSTADYFYKEEWSLLSERQKLKFIPAFSRDQPDKIYVQDRLIENGELVWNLIDQQNAVVYLSGNAKRMPEDVMEAFHLIFIKFGGLLEEEAKLKFKSLEKSKRFQQECWS